MFKHMHLPHPDFQGPVNHARGSLRTCLHGNIWEKIGGILEKGKQQSECTHWAETAGHYFAALTEIGVYPLEISFTKSSVNELLERLEEFDMTDRSDANCDFCRANWKSIVQYAILATRDKFDGLCLDCMGASKLKHEKTKPDYWKSLGPSGGEDSWCQDCRISHGRTTWYVSWCGRDEHRQQLLDDWRSHCSSYWDMWDYPVNMHGLKPIMVQRDLAGKVQSCVLKD